MVLAAFSHVRAHGTCGRSSGSHDAILVLHPWTKHSRPEHQPVPSILAVRRSGPKFNYNPSKRTLRSDEKPIRGTPYSWAAKAGYFPLRQSGIPQPTDRLLRVRQACRLAEFLSCAARMNESKFLFFFPLYSTNDSVACWAGICWEASLLAHTKTVPILPAERIKNCSIEGMAAPTLVL
ncbi:hypothetical protein K432DRAFT_112931 [Lepidopterella palustris CBS 459.81]|uniref:Uncharacterized protein n=1 Tax=Lepidopterella palustris CBS 459.81 TaxID=1314670 RepID=A0A8E2JCP3_9PEZI|nr:hypothetical protein K432DRAFT_112931 [Lepidopterella palustris CBS 459.81]